MGYQIRTESRPTNNGLEGTIWILEGQDTGIEVWPAFGFNCLRWYQTISGIRKELLYVSPGLYDEIKPTRSGFPILFPFPNRIREGKFSWEGKNYQLALGDPSGQNAIHGFACHSPWRVVDSGSSSEEAWIRGEFSPVQDAPETFSLWPTQYTLQICYRLKANALQVQALITNPDNKPLPFGMGFHPYFRLPDSEEKSFVQVGANQYWELQESLPTKTRLNAVGRTDLSKPKKILNLQLDDVLTDLADLSPGNPHPENMRNLAILSGEEGKTRVEVWADPAYREMVVFIPPHRQAICLEPYTCTTDAINLQQKGENAGLLILDPGERWSANLEIRLRCKND